MCIRDRQTAKYAKAGTPLPRRLRVGAMVVPLVIEMVIWLLAISIVSRGGAAALSSRATSDGSAVLDLEFFRFCGQGGDKRISGAA